MKFIRVRGRVIPIREQNEISKSKAAAVGTAVGATVHVRKGLIAAKVESMAKNHRSLKKFTASIQPGDILVMGSTSKHSGGHLAGDWMSKPIRKLFGLKRNDVLMSNANILTSVGAGKKYHGGIYMGKGKISHMSTDAGAVIEKISDAARKQNITALRFSNASKSETKSALNFAGKAVKKSVSYKKTMGVDSAISNLIAPIAKKSSQSFSPMVCHTLPIRAYVKRAFALGEHTYAGDFIKTPGITAVARHDVVKTGLTGAKAFVGNAAKGLKWGAAAVIGAAAINYALKRRRGKDAV